MVIGFELNIKYIISITIKEQLSEIWNKFIITRDKTRINKCIFISLYN